MVAHIGFSSDLLYGPPTVLFGVMAEWQFEVFLKRSLPANVCFAFRSGVFVGNSPRLCLSDVSLATPPPTRFQLVFYVASVDKDEPQTKYFMTAAGLVEGGGQGGCQMNQKMTELETFISASEWPHIAVQSTQTWDFGNRSG